MKDNNKSNEKKVRLNFFSYDYSKVEEYLGAMAREGWILDHIKNSSLHFKKTKPKTVNFRLLPYNKSKNKAKDKNLNRNDLSLQSITEEGWKLIDSFNDTHVFFNENNIRFPGEDKSLTYKLIKKSTLYSLVPIILMCISLFLYTLISFINSPFIDVLMNKPILLLYLIIFPIIAIIYITELVKFIRWQNKSNSSEVEDKDSKKDIIKTFKYRRFVISYLPLLIPILSLLLITADDINNEVKYPVTLPLTLEDINLPVTTNHRKTAHKYGSILVNNTVYMHQYESLVESETSPFQLVGDSLVYSVYKTKFPSLYDDIMQDIILKDPFYKKPYTSIETLPFGSEAAYYTENDEYKSYALSYPDKVVVLTLNFEMTEEQMHIVKEKFQ
ncbi:DUF2812 domain-containing protein [Alloiococcus sp. CFN-8]|uniref:DUF2812 domain-containing protein n=1 Tax=Alloiococcus sp. CFN-8 TaxID=3416081 RepID=UPI003CF18FA9